MVCRNRGNKHQEERKLNLETFGQAKPTGNEQNGKRHRHRGRGRGRSYRGKDKNKILTSDESPRVVKVVGKLSDVGWETTLNIISYLFLQEVA